MNIILLIIIYIIIVYIIYLTSTKTSNISKFSNTNNLNLENNESLSYIPNNVMCDQKLSIIPKDLDYNSYTYSLIGTGINKFYNQKYYLYETKKDQYGNLLIKDNLEYLNEQIYSYIFVTFLNDNPNIDYEFGPRYKINPGDVIYIDNKYLSNGISYIGPFIIL